MAGELVVGRITSGDTVPTGYGQTKVDAAAYPVADIMIAQPSAPWSGSTGAVPSSAADGDNRVVITGARRWGQARTRL